MKGYKAFDKNLCCRGMQYEVGQLYEMTSKPVACVSGYHFCENLEDVYNYYPLENSRVCEVEALGEIDKDGLKLCTNKIKIIRELSDSERKCNSIDKNTGFFNKGSAKNNSGNYNTGNGNTGNSNSGHYNSGSANSGDKNTGMFNTGNENTGMLNSGDNNSGNNNAGIFNSGHCNIGNWNSGYNNIGDANAGWGNIQNRNTGNYNAGSYNSGHYNVGNYNAGDFNISDGNVGAFNTEEPTIRLFNKETDWTVSMWNCSKAKEILMTCPTTKADFVTKSNFSEEEIAKHPEINELGGCIVVVPVSPAEKEAWWNNLSESDKEEIMQLPNFDFEIFKKCIGF